VKKAKVRYYLALAAALITCAVYLPVLQNGFILEWDDDPYVLQNPSIRTFGPAFLNWAFFHFHAANWHPLTWISLATDYAIWGLNPLGYHLTNMLLHAANAFLVVFLVIKLLEMIKQRTAKKTRLAEFLTDRTIFITGGTAGLLFGLHPVHVESVAWIAERKDVLCAFFFLLTIIAYANYVKGLDVKAERQKSLLPFFNRQYLVTGLFFALALLSKPMAVTLPVVLLILDWYPFQRIRTAKTFWYSFVEKLPFFVLSLISSVLTILAQQSGGAITDLERVPFLTRVLVAAKALIAYLWNMFWPLKLLPFYEYNPKSISFGSPEYLFAIVLVLGITTASIVIAKKQKLWLAAWGYYIVTLAPVIGIFQVGSQLMADRYTYLPSLAPFFLVGLLAARITEQVNTANKQRAIARVVIGTAAVSVMVFLSYLTVRQIAVWKDNVVMWSYVIEKDPAAVAAYRKRGAFLQKKGQLDKAIQDYNAQINLEPYDGETYYDRGMIFQKMGQMEKAMEDYDKAISLNPRIPGAYNNRGVIHTITGAFDKAADDFSRLIALKPNHAGAYNNRGFAYFRMGQYGNALEDYNKSLSLDPNYAAAYVNRGNFYVKNGRNQLARTDFQKACELGNNDGCRAFRK
jgi:tetratricopeptide (TPR) repeat protein